MRHFKLLIFEFRFIISHLENPWVLTKEPREVSASDFDETEIC